MTIVLALDPGTEQSGWVEYSTDYRRVIDCGIDSNEDILKLIARPSSTDILAIEMIASYGMAVGREVFETCVWIGRFQQAWKHPNNVQLVYRRDVKLHVCGSSQAKDPNIRRALLDLFPRTGGGANPQVGTKKEPGPLYGVSSHAWSALAVAITAAEALVERA